MGGRFSALLVSLMALQLTLVDRNPLVLHNTTTLASSCYSFYDAIYILIVTLDKGDHQKKVQICWSSAFSEKLTPNSSCFVIWLPSTFYIWLVFIIVFTDRHHFRVLDTGSKVFVRTLSCSLYSAILFLLRFYQIINNGNFSFLHFNFSGQLDTEMFLKQPWWQKLV